MIISKRLINASIALTVFTCGLAQSLRVSAPSPTPLPEEASSTAAANRAPARDAANYKFIFNGSMSRFVAELNKAGELGYRFSSAIFDWQVGSGTTSYASPITLLKLDEGKYEYAFFEIRSGDFYGASGFAEQYQDFAKRAFHLVDHFWVAGGCDYINSENIAAGMTCDTTRMFLMERTAGTRAVEFHVAGDPSIMRGLPGRSIAAEINEKLAAGYSPVNIVSRSQVLLEKIAPEDQLPGERPHVEFVSASSGRMNELGKRGYHPALVFDERALMFREPQAAAAGHYVMLTAKNSDVQRKLTALQQRNAVYRGIYRDGHLSGDKLIFEEQERSSPTAPHEYKVLRLEFKLDSGGNPLPPDGEALTALDGLIAQGFVVRTLFRTNKAYLTGLLLER